MLQLKYYPGNWHKFLANVENKKKELFLLLSEKISEDTFPDEKDV